MKEFNILKMQDDIDKIIQEELFKEVIVDANFEPIIGMK